MDNRLMSYLYCFNVQADYYECHEYGESLWLDTGRPIVLKGLIQAAVCLYHLYNGNVRGGYAMWVRAKGYLAPSLPSYEGIDLTALTRDIDAVFARVPKELKERIVAPEHILDLSLPTVKIAFVDPLLEEKVHSWTLAQG
ncbi:MAG: DUF309 domain-containing protein [Firmicutes bacterium]|nr:DUF309 domain-containing protein [Bacillota bacterium]